MYCRNLKKDEKIIITDTESGVSFEITYYHDKAGKPTLAFDAPLSIRIQTEKAEPHQVTR